MPTNKEFLYSLDPHALTEWFDAEHTSNDILSAKKVVSVHTGTANDANVSEHVEDANGTLDGARMALDAKFAELTAKCYELQAEVDELTAERDNLADDLLACNRERETLRKQLGIALDYAHDMLALVDMDGNVYDVGD